MKIAYFTHSLRSCWNHGNAHFVRGVLRGLVRRGHEVAAYEPVGAWSLDNLLFDHGETALAAFRDAYPELSSQQFDERTDLEESLSACDAVIVHEWNDPWLVAALGRMRRAGASFTLLFHDTHHRAVSDPDAIRQFDLNGYDAVLAFGETLAEVYRRWGWGKRVHVWHEAAGTQLFRPPVVERERSGVVWIGNWGDGERSAELERFLLQPVRSSDQTLDVYGVRYPDRALDLLRRYGTRYHGWLANAQAPAVFARHRATVHVPRRFYVDLLPGIPTIRVFEALACGIPLVCAPWHDSEHLFRPGEDFLVARNSGEMERHLRAIERDPELRRVLVDNGLSAIRDRHSCAHRAEQLLALLATLGLRPPVEMSA